MTAGDEGYTLVEALTALVIVGLAMAGVSQAVLLGSRQVSRIVAAHRTLADQVEAGRLMRRLPPTLGPFEADDRGFAGGPHLARFPCGRPGAFCALEARGDQMLVQVGEARTARRFGPGASLTLRYVGADGGLHESWPSSPSAGRLKAVAVMSGDTPWTVLGLPVSQAADCSFNRSNGECTVVEARR